ncbi:MAG: imidazolonepropionase [Acidobacteria bacterium]|nr:imidazolonepropionase [Acidobacteriota bacterium]
MKPGTARFQRAEAALEASVRQTIGSRKGQPKHAGSVRSLVLILGKAVPELLAIINCSQLVTLAGPARARVGPELRELSIISDGAMLVRGDRIEKVGARAEIEPLINAVCEVMDAGGRLVMPGFVDAHTHPVFAGTRADEFAERVAGTTYQQIAARGGGIQSTVRATRAATQDDLVEIAKRYARWFLRGGTTTIEAKSGYGLSVEDELKILRAIKRLGEDAETHLRYVPTFLGAHEVPEEYRSRREAYIELLIEEMIPLISEQKLAECCDVFCEQNVFSVAESRQILSAARTKGMRLRLHADQFSLSGGAKLAAELGTATADHLEHTDAEGIGALKAANVQPVLLPASVYALGSARYPAARAMIDAGLAIVLATDFNPGSSPTTSMPLVLSLASTQMKVLPEEAISAVTINAAYSLGRGEQIGSLETGKLADFVIHDVQDYRHLAYFFGREHAWKVYVGGRPAFAL